MKHWFCAIIFLMANGIFAAPFQVGEKLTYQASWGPFVAADLTFEVAPATRSNLWRFLGFCQSRGVVETFYPVRSRVESRVLKSPFVTESFFEDRKEGSRRYLRYTELDFQTKRGSWMNYETGKNKKLKLSEGPAVDLFSAVYYARTLNWVSDQTRHLQVFHNGKYRKLAFTAQDFRERNIKNWGKQKTFEIVCNEIFQAATETKGNLKVVVTDDEQHVPVEAQLNVKWGTVNLILTGAENLTGSALNK